MTQRAMRLRAAKARRPKTRQEDTAPKKPVEETAKPTTEKTASVVTVTPVSAKGSSYWEGSLYDYLQYWLTTYKKGTVKPTTYDTLERVILSYIKDSAIGPVPLTALTSDAIQLLLSDLKDEGYSYSTVKKVYDCINAAVKHAIARKAIPDNPMLLVELPGKSLFTNKEVSFFTVRECNLIIEEALRTYATGRRIYVYGDAIILMLLTGIRLGEAIGLRKSDYDRERKMLKVRRNIHKVRNRDEDGNLLPGRSLCESTTKSYSGMREIPLTGLAVEVLERLVREYPLCESLICNTKGAMATPEQIDRTFRYLLTNVGLEGSGVHKLRHTFATLLFASQKVDVKTISKMLGHASVTITLVVYTHIADQIPHTAVTPLDDLF